ncbi:thiamine pyrophosphate-binding protein [Xinfangfangia sp. D13-10-4-6]|uniref:thiamine pyrophosphate-binding protein n=1 Tax=Pseudogemmobacter hezensis TaxID=2737662 RepID=UPI001557B790|nr:thiamine pyrophosphate-binding protein [Pseudogemmobacter hezensis]NPD17439.1 thiamine pyrophosphate-binding protein [Pseudogemmobacter hezensis]
MNHTTGASWLAKSLAARGVDHVFFIDAILRRSLVEMEHEGIRRVLVHSEKAAAYMADGYARVRGTPGICFSQSVGAANLAAGMQDAWLAQTPVLAFTGRKHLKYQHRNAYQEVDHAPLFQAVTKASIDANDSADLPRLLAHAWRTAMTGTPGPVHLDVLGHMGELIEKGTVDAEIAAGLPQSALPLRRLLADDAELEPALARLTGAARVVIVAGTGATQSDAGPEILELAEALKAPVATSLGARGIIPTRHPLSAGTVGNYSAPPANEIVGAADVVFYIGCRTGDQVTLDWRVPGLATPIVQLDIDPTELGRSYPDTLGICGDPKRSLRRLIELLGVPDGRGAGFADWAAAQVAEWRTEFAARAADRSGPIRVETILDDITATLPETGIVVADTGFSSIWTCTGIELNGAGQTYLRAAGSLGWSFPAALGAQCAAPNRRVVCFTGDGGLYYHLPELETARRYNIPLVLVINNNSGFGQSIENIRTIQGSTPGTPEELGLFGPLDFARIAREFGVEGHRIERAEDLRPALAAAFKAKGPVVLDVITDIEPRAPVAWKP